MGRKLASLFLFTAFLVSAWTFFSREQRVLRETINSAQNEYRIKLEDFAITNYEDGEITEKISAKLGFFVEPNLVELNGDVQGERVSELKSKNGGSSRKEVIRSDHASVYLRATSLNMLLSQSAEVDRAELTGFVQVAFNDHLLTTDYAEYLQNQKVIQSPRKVKVLGPNRSFEGDEGFVYSLEQEILEIKGMVRGVTTLEN